MFKISIRVSILVLFATLLIGVGSTIMFVNYAADKGMLLSITEGAVQLSYNTVSEKITSFLQPLNERIDVGARAIRNGLITPVQDERFTKFLLHILGDSANFYAIHWSDPGGNFYYLERSANGTFISERVVCSLNTCTETTQKIDRFGAAITVPSKVPNVFDPRTRPWYIQANKEKRYILSDIYLFAYRPNVGVTASYPIYSVDGNLRGILSIDETLTALSNFVENIKVTQNSNVFIFTDNDDLVAAKELQNLKSKSLLKVSNIDVPWVQESFKIYKSSKNSLFFYKYNGEWYLAYYRSIQNIVQNPWHIAIVLPVNDVISGLKENLAKSGLIATMVLLFGMLLVSIISKAISRPIVNLAKEAALIEQMNLTQIVSSPSSRIKEIHFMQEAFSAMRQSLTSFMRYVPSALVKKLIASGDVAHVGGESKEITFLFADIKGFTSLSENMEPQELMNYLSEYFQMMTRVILAHQGTVDKYIGDAVMAFWGAPLEDKRHAEHACQCAIEIQREVKELNEKWRKEGKPTVAVRIGMNTGHAIIGNVGSEDRLSYTVLGDSVNLASRLEGLNKLYRTYIIVGENTYQQVKNEFNFRLLDQVVVRGKNKSSYVYELLFGVTYLENKLNKYDPTFLEAFAAYQKGDWDKAIEIFNKLGNLYLGDNLIQLYLERCKNFKINPPEGWDGVWRVN